MEKTFLEDCLAQGLTLEQIGSRAGLAKSTVCYHVKRHGLVAVNKESAGNKGPIEREQLAAMLDRGLSLRQIGDELGRSASNIRHWAIRHKLALPQARRRAEMRRARLSGAVRPVIHCKVHGPTEHGLTRDQVYECLRCRGEAVVRWRQRAKRKLVDEAGGQCRICGYSKYAGALHFHHVNPAEKEFGLASSGYTRSIERLRAEARKCVLLCSNCHAEVEAGVARLELGRQQFPGAPM